VDCDHANWNSSKIISKLDTGSLCVRSGPNIMDLLQREHPEILTGIGKGIKKWLSSYKSSNISETPQDRTKITIA